MSPRPADPAKAAKAYAAAAGGAPRAAGGGEAESEAGGPQGDPLGEAALRGDAAGRSGGEGAQPGSSGEDAQPGFSGGNAQSVPAGGEAETVPAAEELPGNGSVVEHDLEELTARAEKADEYLSLAQRTRADFENFRKRASREAGLAQERGIAKLAKELLPAIDNLDRAVQAAESFASGSPEEAVAEVESQLASGIKLVHADVLAALARVGIEPFSPAGEPFDPQFHEAVAQHPIEGKASGTVVEVYQQGYRLGETVLRPARVLVAA